MQNSKKIRVAVLFGGRSGEHEISILSASNVIQNLDRSRFEVVPIGIDKKGAWFLGEDKLLENPQQQLQLQCEAERMLFAPDLLGKHATSLQVKQTFLGNERLFDVIFPVIHGTLCEDGTVQGLLELADVPYVGCGVLASAVGMDKDVSKRLIMNAGLNVPAFLVIKQGQWKHAAAEFCERITHELDYPVFVKPANTGSSVGVQKVKAAKDLTAAINNAFRYDTKVIVEKGIDAIELEVAVLEAVEDGADPIVSVVGEVRPTATHEFYSYASKYLDEKGAELMIPATVPAELQAKAQVLAKTIFAALECEGMARVDLFLERGTEQIYFNEVNTIPGFTQISMYPRLMAASGVNYSQLLTHLVETAINRHARKSQLMREYAQ